MISFGLAVLLGVLIFAGWCLSTSQSYSIPLDTKCVFTFKNNLVFYSKGFETFPVGDVYEHSIIAPSVSKDHKMVIFRNDLNNLTLCNLSSKEKINIKTENSAYISDSNKVTYFEGDSIKVLDIKFPDKEPETLIQCSSYNSKNLFPQLLSNGISIVYLMGGSKSDYYITFIADPKIDSSPEKIFEFESKEDVISGLISADEKKYLLHLKSRTYECIKVFDLVTEEMKEIFRQNVTLSNVVWSSDGESIYFVETLESGSSYLCWFSEADGLVRILLE